MSINIVLLHPTLMSEVGPYKTRLLATVGPGNNRMK